MTLQEKEKKERLKQNVEQIIVKQKKKINRRKLDGVQEVRVGG